MAIGPILATHMVMNSKKNMNVTGRKEHVQPDYCTVRAKIKSITCVDVTSTSQANNATIDYGVIIDGQEMVVRAFNVWLGDRTYFNPSTDVVLDLYKNHKGQYIIEKVTTYLMEEYAEIIALKGNSIDNIEHYICRTMNGVIALDRQFLKYCCRLGLQVPHTKSNMFRFTIDKSFLKKLHII